MFQWLKDFFQQDRLGGIARSPRWGETKRLFELAHPKKCAVCEKTKCALHHKLPFHKDPSQELNFENLIWLCEGLGTGNHHLWFGHLGSFLSFNKDVEIDSEIFNEKIKSRPI